MWSASIVYTFTTGIFQNWVFTGFTKFGNLFWLFIGILSLGAAVYLDKSLIRIVSTIVTNISSNAAVCVSLTIVGLRGKVLEAGGKGYYFYCGEGTGIGFGLYFYARFWNNYIFCIEFVCVGLFGACIKEQVKIFIYFGNLFWILGGEDV